MLAIVGAQQLHVLGHPALAKIGFSLHHAKLVDNNRPRYEISFFLISKTSRVFAPFAVLLLLFDVVMQPFFMYPSQLNRRPHQWTIEKRHFEFSIILDKYFVQRYTDRDIFGTLANSGYSTFDQIMPFE